MSFSALDHAHMALALRLAERGLYTTDPNPRVGCVLAHGADVVGAGWHERAGEPHAEVFALRQAGDRARGATAYVTLEPCAHFGRTPPCANALVEAGVARVVAACEDPNPKVAGGGFAALRAAGIAVEVGLLRDAARELNRGFLSRLERGRPWLRVKLAMSLDGRTALADGRSHWITGPAARADVQRWRARSSAILTGSGTVLADDPRLTVRHDPLTQPSPPSELGGEGLRDSLIQPAPTGKIGGEGLRDSLSRPSPPCELGGEGLRYSLSPDAVGGEGWGEGAALAAAAGVQPLRIVLDRTLCTPVGAHLLDGSAPTLILHAPGAQPADPRFARAELAPVALDAQGRLDLAAVLRLAAARGVNELQVEAGPTLCGALFAAGLVDELLLYVAPVVLGDTARPLLALPALESLAQARRLRMVEQRQVGDDLRILLRE